MLDNSLNFNDVPEFAKSPKKHQLVWDGAPLQYRFNAATGQFQCANMLLPGLRVQPLIWRWNEDIRGGHRMQYWLDLLFTDDYSVVSLLSVNKGRAESIAAALKDLQRSRDFDVKPHAVKFLLAPFGIESAEGKHYSLSATDVEWAKVEEVEAAEEFLIEGFPRDPWILAGEVGGQ